MPSLPEMDQLGIVLFHFLLKVSSETDLFRQEGLVLAFGRD